MPWKELSLVSQRLEFVKLAEAEGTNVAELCRRFRISRKTGYKWLARSRSGGVEALADRPRRPLRSPAQCDPQMEQQVLAVRRAHPAWGGRKIRRVLKNQGMADPPAASTITEILRRHGVLNDAPTSPSAPAAWHRFEHERPNDLWQMDFKGHFGLANGSRCHPLTVLDDHSRYNVVLDACGDQKTATVKRQLTAAFERYGLPRRMLMDNGSPWGDCAETRFTPLTVWLLRLEVGVSHSRPYHPQTQGKDERFHRTLDLELLREQAFDNHTHAQRGFDAWRPTYNFDRPHEALDMLTPAERYEPSKRSMPQKLPPIEYPSGDAVRKVQAGGYISYAGRSWRLPKAFRGEPVALRPTDQDGLLAVYYVGHQIAELDLHENCVSSAGAASVRSAHSSHPSR